MSERDDLFEMWSRHGSSFESDSSEGYELADAILNSPWLAAREERVRAEEREQCAQIAASFRLNADVETVVGLSWNRDMDKLIAAIRERQAPEVERVRADERAKAQAEFIDWLIETVHYPFDVTYDVPPPIDIDALADRWNEVDGWHVSAEEARACVREEAAIRAVSEQEEG